MRSVINVIVVGSIKDADEFIQRLGVDKDSIESVKVLDQEKTHPVLVNVENNEKSSRKGFKRPSAGKPGMYAEDNKARRKSAEIRNLRRSIDLTQKQLAGIIGYTTTEISYFETGIKPAPTAYIRRLNKLKKQLKIDGKI